MNGVWFIHPVYFCCCVVPLLFFVPQRWLLAYHFSWYIFYFNVRHMCFRKIFLMLAFLKSLPSFFRAAFSVNYLFLTIGGIPKHKSDYFFEVELYFERTFGLCCIISTCSSYAMDCWAEGLLVATCCHTFIIGLCDCRSWYGVVVYANKSINICACLDLFGFIVWQEPSIFISKCIFKKGSGNLYL